MENMSITLPLEAQFTIRRVELEVEDMSKEELQSLVVHLTFQRILERAAITQLLKEENINIQFDLPTEEDIEEMLEYVEGMGEGDEDQDPFDFFTS